MVQLLRWCVAGLGSLAVAVSLPQSRVADVLDRYDRGEYDAGIASLNLDTLTVGALRTESERWIAAADTAGRARRRLTAAAFAVDALRIATTNADNAPSVEGDWHLGLRPWDALSVRSVGARLPVVAWACGLVSGLDTTDPAERWWWLASVGILEDARAWDALVGGSKLVSNPPLDPAMSRILQEGHLAHARRRFPDEPRWDLAEIVARSRRAVGPSNRPLDLMGLRRADVLRDERHERSEAIAGVRREFERLAREHPPLAGEAELHAGYLELVARRWRDALTHLERARPLVDEPFLLATLDYFRGWAHERLDEAAEAVASYERAHALAPNVRNLSILLAAQLYLANDRTRAFEVLDSALTASSAPDDLRAMFERGDARLVPDYVARMREGLR